MWTYPARSTKTPSYAFHIVQRAGLTPPAQHQTLLFPMTHDGDKLARAWMRAAETVLPWLQAGQDVLFLVEGDASTYATFGHLARTVQALDARIDVPVIAGVNAFAAACAARGMPLAEQDDTIAIVPAAYGVSAVDRLLTDFDTLVLMKVKPLMDDLIDWLTLRELLPHTQFIERVGAPGRAQRERRGPARAARHQGQLPLAHDREEPAPHSRRAHQGLPQKDLACAVACCGWQRPLCRTGNR